ncbi:MAG: GNAT family N-acetyltransferase [Paracoccus sp. (in: a-proteobacteria)]|uniref:GNAT family N-acetyltransferase n=1 Tax=Paracoccus sp. TaxID=267 RepID=UPI00391D0516
MINIRPVCLGDLDALYAISLATSYAGGDASHLHNDPQITGQIYSAPYAVLEPHLCLVIEDAKGVAGFAVGTINTRAWEDRLEKEWWPHLRVRYADPARGSKDAWSADERRAFMIHHPSRAPEALLSQFPSHLHMNLLPRIQGMGFGAEMFGRWQDMAVKRGSNGIHVGVNPANKRAIGFWESLGFTELRLEGVERNRTIWMGFS